MKDETILTLTSILALAFLEGLALYNKIDGTTLSLVIAAISGLGGYSLKSYFVSKKGQ